MVRESRRDLLDIKKKKIVGNCSNAESSVHCDDPKGGDVGGDVCIHIADSLCCIAETNTTLENDYTPIKKER